MSRRNLPSRNVMLMVAWCACALGVIGWAGLANAQNLPLAGSGYDQNMVVGANETFASASHHGDHGWRHQQRGQHVVSSGAKCRCPHHRFADGHLVHCNGPYNGR